MLPERVMAFPVTMLSLILTGVGDAPSLAGMVMLVAVMPVRSLFENEFPAELRKVIAEDPLPAGGVPVQLSASLQRAGVSAVPRPVQVAWAASWDGPARSPAMAIIRNGVIFMVWWIFSGESRMGTDPPTEDLLSWRSRILLSSPCGGGLGLLDRAIALPLWPAGSGVSNESTGVAPDFSRPISGRPCMRAPSEVTSTSSGVSKDNR
jgi:hypothetical protein